jgi:dienelactone hydrolase
VLSSLVLSKQYVSDVPNTKYTGTGAVPLRGAWSDPVKPTVVHDVNTGTPLSSDPSTQVGALVLLPATAAPAAGWPVVIFQHGITRARGDVLAVAGGLTNSGFAVVAIDAVNHGTRAVRISNTTVGTISCADVNVGIPAPRTDRGPDPTAKSDCYAPVLSPDLAATRDTFRQTVLDIQQLTTSLKACGTTACGALKVNANNIFYMGHSLIGGNLGSLAVASSDNIKAGVLNAAGAGWLDIIENTAATVKFQCPLVDALIDAGLLMGAKYDATAMTGLCTTDAWKTMPGYRSFAAIGQWLLNPADPANFGAKLATRTFLLQGVVPDEVVPRQMTLNLGALSGRQRGEGSCGTFTNIGTSTQPNLVFFPSSAVLATPTDAMFLEYVTVAPGSAECPPGNTYSHGSLLQPAPSVTGGTCNPSTGANCDGAFATRRLQTDAGYFLLQNKQ